MHVDQSLSPVWFALYLSLPSPSSLSASTNKEEGKANQISMDPGSSINPLSPAPYQHVRTPDLVSAAALK